MLRRYDYITIAAMIAMFVTAFLVWNRVPDELPVHWNAAGEVDRYGLIQNAKIKTHYFYRLFV